MWNKELKNLREGIINANKLEKLFLQKRVKNESLKERNNVSSRLPKEHWTHKHCEIHDKMNKIVDKYICWPNNHNIDSRILRGEKKEIYIFILFSKLLGEKTFGQKYNRYFNPNKSST